MSAGNRRAKKGVSLSCRRRNALGVLRHRQVRECRASASLSATSSFSYASLDVCMVRNEEGGNGNRRNLTRKMLQEMHVVGRKKRRDAAVNCRSYSGLAEYAASRTSRCSEFVRRARKYRHCSRKKTQDVERRSLAPVSRLHLLLARYSMHSTCTAADSSGLLCIDQKTRRQKAHTTLLNYCRLNGKSSLAIGYCGSSKKLGISFTSILVVLLIYKFQWKEACVPGVWWYTICLFACRLGESDGDECARHGKRSWFLVLANAIDGHAFDTRDNAGHSFGEQGASAS